LILHFAFFRAGFGRDEKKENPKPEIPVWISSFGFRVSDFEFQIFEFLDLQSKICNLKSKLNLR